MRWTRVVAAMTAIVVLAGCAVNASDSRSLGLRIMVPNSPGSGYDVTARVAARALEDAGIVREVEVFNLSGTDGTVGLQRLVNEKGNSRLLMLMGLGLVGSQYTHQSRASLLETTPIARLVEEPNIVVVTPDSPFHTLADLVTAWRTDPSGVSVGGGSAPGGPDHLAAMLLAQSVGVAPKKVRYARHDGGGALLAAILGRRVSFGVSGLSEYVAQIRSGQLRVLAVTSAQRLPDLAAPTLQESGIDVVFTNWRGVVAPPGLSDADAAELGAWVARLHASDEWRDAMSRNGWTDAYTDGEAFTKFVRSESDRVAKVLDGLGLFQ